MIDTKNYVLYDSIYMEILEKKKLQRQKDQLLPKAGDGNRYGLQTGICDVKSVLKLNCGDGRIII